MELQRRSYCYCNQLLGDDYRSNLTEVLVNHHVRTYVNHVNNICHLELANPLTKHTLLVIG